MSHVIEVPFSIPEIKAIVRAAFPDATSHRNVKVATAERVHVSDYWSEGSRTFTAFVRLADMTGIPSGAIPREACQQAHNPLNLTIADVDLPPGYACVEHAIFRSKDLGYRVTLNPVNMVPNLLPVAPEVDARDRRILTAIRSLKSGPYRQEALRALAFTAADRDRLAARGLLKVSTNGATGITNEGRAACAND